jgi:hypothetical protein
VSGDSKEKFMTVTKLLGVAAVGAMLAMAIPAERAQALSLINPGTAATVDHAATPTTEVHWHGHWHHRGHWHPHHRWHHWHHRRW